MLLELPEDQLVCSKCGGKESFLKGFEGALVTDGYAGYNQVAKVTHHGCWSHARRKWREAMPTGAAAKTSKAAVGFQYCNKLFCRRTQVRYIYAEISSSLLNNGEVPISNNLAENAIRPFTLGRKNWLFCNTPKGAEASAVVYSVVETAKANGIEPFAYLQQVLMQLPYLGRSPSHEDLDRLMPWAPIMQQKYKIPDSDAYEKCYLD